MLYKESHHDTHSDILQYTLRSVGGSVASIALFHNELNCHTDLTQ